MATYEPPRLVLGLQGLAGGTLATRDRAAELRERFREPESLAVTISKALDAGADGILAGATALLRHAMVALGRPVPLFALVPALTETERGEYAPSLEDLIARGRSQAKGAGLARAMAASLAQPPLVKRGNWGARLGELLELEMSGLLARDRRGLVLEVSVTDLALAAGNRRLFERFCRLARGRFKAAAGFETHNLGLMLERLSDWELKPDFVIGPVNPCGLRMKPDPQQVIAQMARSDVPVVAKDLRAGGAIPLDEGARFAREHGAFGVAPDLADMDDVPGALRALAAPLAGRSAA